MSHNPVTYRLAGNGAHFCSQNDQNPADDEVDGEVTGTHSRRCVARAVLCRAFRQDDLLSFNPASRSLTTADRALTVDLWYPAVLPEGAKRETYIASLPSEPPASPANFTFPSEGCALSREAR